AISVIERAVRVAVTTVSSMTVEATAPVESWAADPWAANTTSIGTMLMQIPVGRTMAATAFIQLVPEKNLIKVTF
ncbi:MAG: hypothetical protein AAF680_11755, partial [Pseudomonadota bacterium]